MKMSIDRLGSLGGSSDSSQRKTKFFQMIGKRYEFEHACENNNIWVAGAESDKKTWEE